MTLRERLVTALAEDLGPGDLTTEAVFGPEAVGQGQIVAKADVVVSGLAAAALAFEVAAAHYGAAIRFEPLVADGTRVPRSTSLAKVSGSMRALLVGERLALNLLMRLCGIATHVRQTLDEVGPTTFRAVDTRKTTPLWRDLEKAAVRDGGGHNHRFGLFDGVLIKDNHVEACGGVGEAVARAKSAVHHLVKVEVEVTRLDQLADAFGAGADGVLLDNMDDATIAEAVRTIRARWPHGFVEASGNMNAARMKALAQVGLDVISVGGFIHQARWVDLSLEVTS